MRLIYPILIVVIVIMFIIAFFPVSQVMFDILWDKLILWVKAIPEP